MFGFNRRPWALHNPLKSWTLANLSLRECQLLVASMTDAEMKVSWATCNGWNEWKPLSEPMCHDLFLLKEADVPPNLPELPQMQQEDDHEITEVRMMAAPQKVQAPIQRKHVRFVAKIPVEIVAGANSFSTNTLDLSEGGFCFEDKLPDWVAGYFTVVLNAEDQMFEFTCFLAEDQKKDKFRTEISPTTAEQVLKDFKTWLYAQKLPETPPR